ncbi:hypothetical protein EDB19DRAFT_1708643 [Suillus lakei]|nr:hypothetical protein EDB19DRAFT_1708643 [Suillus lakei]
MRVTTLQEDIAYSLFGIFGVHLPVMYGETRSGGFCRRSLPSRVTPVPLTGSGNHPSLIVVCRSISFPTGFHHACCHLCGRWSRCETWMVWLWNWLQKFTTNWTA